MRETSFPIELLDSSGKRFVQGRQLAVGGEGSIQEVLSAPDVVIKRYLADGQQVSGREQLKIYEQKILHLLENKPQLPEDLKQYREQHFWAWPIKQLYSSQGYFVAYLMPRLTGVKGEEFMQFSSGYPWSIRLQASRNLVALVQATHAADYVIGDLNTRNLFFKPFSAAASQADHPVMLPSLVDTDSFQIGGVRSSEIRYACNVQNPEYSSPELINNSKNKRTVEQEYFSLAIVIFQILSLGVHPFAGIVKNSKNQELRLNIAKGRSLLHSADVTPPQAMVPLEVFPPQLLELFNRTFRLGHTVTRLRATTEQWLDVLDGILQDGLLACAAVPNHHYAAHLSRCPWCDYIERHGIDPFNLPDLARQGKARQARIITQASGHASTSNGPAYTSGPTRLGAQPNTIFGPIPTEWKMSDSEASTNTTLWGPVPTEWKIEDPKLGSNKSGMASEQVLPQQQRAPTKRDRRPSILWLVLGLGLTLLGLAWFLSGGGLGFIQTHRPSLEGLSVAQEAMSDTFSLIIDICIDSQPPYDCSTQPQAISGVVPVINSMQTGRPIVLQDESVGRVSRYKATGLSAGRYQITLSEDKLKVGYRRCAVSEPQLNPLGNPSTIDLSANQVVVFSYCKQEP